MRIGSDAVDPLDLVALMLGTMLGVVAVGDLSRRFATLTTWRKVALGLGLASVLSYLLSEALHALRVALHG